MDPDARNLETWKITSQMRQAALGLTAQAPTSTSTTKDRISRPGISTIFPTGGLSVEFRLGIETDLNSARFRERLFVLMLMLLLAV